MSQPINSSVNDDLSEIPADMRDTVVAKIAAFRDRANRRDLERLQQEEKNKDGETSSLKREREEPPTNDRSPSDVKRLRGEEEKKDGATGSLKYEREESPANAASPSTIADDSTQNRVDKAPNTKRPHVDFDAPISITANLPPRFDIFPDDLRNSLSTSIASNLKLVNQELIALAVAAQSVDFKHVFVYHTHSKVHNITKPDPHSEPHTVVVNDVKKLKRQNTKDEANACLLDVALKAYYKDVDEDDEVDRPLIFSKFVPKDASPMSNPEYFQSDNDFNIIGMDPRMIEKSYSIQWGFDMFGCLALRMVKWMDHIAHVKEIYVKRMHVTPMKKLVWVDA